VDHANAVLPELEARLAQALAARHRAAIARHRAIGAEIYRKLRAALVEAGKAQALALQARADAIAEIGEGQAHLHLPVVAFMGLLTPDLLQLYFDQMDRVMAPPPPNPVAAAPKPLPKPKARPMIEISPGAAPVRVARQPIRDSAPADDGERLLTILRNGVEVENRQLAVGDIVRIRGDLARQLLRSGAAELARESAV
jgi:hypothetical protein